MALTRGEVIDAAYLPEWSEELQAEADQLLQLCKEMGQTEPDVEVSHHQNAAWEGDEACGCPSLFRRGEYPFFVCIHCMKLVPWCYGCDNEDEYLAACCDGCWYEFDQKYGGKDD